MDVHGAVVAVAIEANAGKVLDNVVDVGCPDWLLGSVLWVQSQHDQVGQLERIPVCIAQGAVQHELEGKARPSIGRFSLHQVNSIEPPRIRGFAINALSQHRSQLGSKGRLQAVVGEPGRPDPGVIALFMQPMVDRLLRLGRTQIQDLSTGLQDGLELSNGRQQLVPHQKGG